MILTIWASTAWVLSTVTTYFLYISSWVGIGRFILIKLDEKFGFNLTRSCGLLFVFSFASVSIILTSSVSYDCTGVSFAPIFVIVRTLFFTKDKLARFFRHVSSSIEIFSMICSTVMPLVWMSLSLKRRRISMLSVEHLSSFGLGLPAWCIATIPSPSEKQTVIFLFWCLFS